MVSQASWYCKDFRSEDRVLRPRLNSQLVVDMLLPMYYALTDEDPRLVLRRVENQFSDHLILSQNLILSLGSEAFPSAE